MTVGSPRNDEARGRLPESAPERVKRRQAVARALAAEGIGDVHVLSTESAERALTPARRELVNVLAHEAVDSQRHLAELLDRDPGNVKRDLNVLIEEGIVGRERTGRAYRPFLKHDLVVAEPLPSPAEE